MINRLVRIGTTAFLFLLGSTLSVSTAEGQTDVRIAVLPVVGSTPGQFGSYFKTAIQIFNAATIPLTYRAVFHPSGVPGSPSDPSATVTVPAGAVQYYADFLPAIGISTGIGSLDVYVPPSELGSLNGIAVARVYNDAGAAGTTGFTEEFYNPLKVYAAGDTAQFVCAPNQSSFRNNIGIRTLDDGASLSATLRDSSGAFVKAVTKSYMANFFEQTSLDAFLEGATLVGNESLTIQIASGGGIIYVSTVDNVTQDPSVSVGP